MSLIARGASVSRRSDFYKSFDSKDDCSSPATIVLAEGLRAGPGVVSGRAAGEGELDAALPQLLEFALTPCLGTTEARRIVSAG